MEILISYDNFKGGINNLQIAYVVNERLQIIKSFTSLKRTVMNKAIKFINNINNNKRI